jgi:hypothetical protein
MSVSCICGWIGRDWDDGVSHVIESAGLPGGPHEVWNPGGEMFGQLDDAAPPSPDGPSDDPEHPAAPLHGNGRGGER